MTARNQASSNRLACLLLAALAMLGCVQSALADDPPLSLTIRAMSTEIVVGEPIVLEVTLKNTGDEVLAVDYSLERWNISYCIARQDEELRHLRDLLVICGLPGSRQLEPNGTIEHVQWLAIDYDAEWIDGSTPQFAAPEAGVYVLQVQYSTRTEPNGVEFWSIESNRIEIVVSEPCDECVPLLPSLRQIDDRPIFDDGPQLPGSIYREIDSTAYRESVQHRKELLEEIADSSTPYASYASLLRGSFELAHRDHGLRGHELLAAQEARALRALEYLEPADKESFPLRSEVVWYIREAAVLLGEDEAVERLTKRLETEFSNTHAATRPIQSKKYTP